jgi:hypothetical protein
MQYMQLARADQDAMLADLAGMPEIVRTAFGHLSPSEATLAGPNGLFSPVEQCWHLADLEREGYGLRIRRLMEEDAPRLPNFDGARMARERNYKALSLAEGINAFQQARFQNLAALRQLTHSDWTRSGSQENVGQVALCDIPGMMVQHDEGHRLEIEAWVLTIKSKIEAERPNGINL